MAENQEFIRSSYPSSSDYFDELAGLRDLYRSSPLPNEELIDQFALYATPASLARFIHFDKSVSESWISPRDNVFGAVVTRG
jgi:hypothetical protein